MDSIRPSRAAPDGSRYSQMHALAGTALLPWQSRRVREYIDARIGTRILISDLSAIAKRSEAHFARAFKRTFGQTPHAYLVRRRVEFASHLMRVSQESLSNIALTCGFTDQAHFCRQFRQIVGQSPAAWRREFEPCAPNPSRRTGRTSTESSTIDNSVQAAAAITAHSLA